MDDHDDVTSEEFYYFVEVCKKLKNYLGIIDWELRFHFMEGGPEDPRASMQVVDRYNRLAVITIYDDWDIAPSRDNLIKVAFHEMLELLFSDCHCLAMDRNFNYDTYDREHHRVIRILEHTFLDRIRGDFESIDIQDDSGEGS